MKLEFIIFGPDEVATMLHLAQSKNNSAACETRHLANLLSHNLIRQNGFLFQLTVKGKEYVHAVCSVKPEPAKLTKEEKAVQRGNALKAARELLESDGNIVILWNIEDVISRAKEKGKRVSKKAARIILDDVENYHDCNYGITWETLDYHTDSYFMDNKLKSK